MGKIFTRIDKNWVAVSIQTEKEIDLGGFKIPKGHTNVPFKIAKILQLSAAGEELYNVGDEVVIRPTKGDVEIPYGEHLFSWITIDDIMAVV